MGIIVPLRFVGVVLRRWEVGVPEKVERERSEDMFMRVYIRRTAAVLSSGKWNKQSTSHYISPRWLDETRQELTAPPHASVSRGRGLNVQPQRECRGDAAAD